MRYAAIVCLVLGGVTAGVYLQTGGHGFINFDDPGYVTENPRVRGGLTGENVAWAFSATAMSNWHPLTWLSHMLDVQLFGLDSGRHHLVNAVLHLHNAALLFLGLRALTGGLWRPAAVAALFAVHPAHVESVAWVSERKVASERTLLRSLIDNLPDHIHAKDTEGRYLLNNAAHRRVLGAASEEAVVGRTVFDFFPEALARSLAADGALVMASGIVGAVAALVAVTGSGAPAD